MKFLDWTKGKKTYAVVAVGLATGLYQWYTGHDVPMYIYWAEGLLGLAAHRSAIADQTRATASAAAALVEDILGMIEVQDNAAQQAPASVITPGATVIIGKPTPPGTNEKSVTDALNAAQVK